MKDNIQKLLSNTGATIKFKDESLLIKFIGLFASIFNKGFMSKVATTFGKTIWFPNRKYYDTLLQDNPVPLYLWLLHECQHVESYKQKGFFGYWVRYLFPQCLSIILIFVSVICFIIGMTLSEFIIVGWVLIGLAVFFLFPWDAPWRIKEELNAEVVSYSWALKNKVDGYRSSVSFCKEICSLNYYNPFYSEKKANDLFEKILKEQNTCS